MGRVVIVRGAPVNVSAPALRCPGQGACPHCGGGCSDQEKCAARRVCPGRGQCRGWEVRDEAENICGEGCPRFGEKVLWLGKMAGLGGVP